jgi:RNA polymerase sigma-70 factor (ECF subfamily)
MPGWRAEAAVAEAAGFGRGMIRLRAVSPTASPARPRSIHSLDAIERERFESTLLPHMRAAYNLARWLTRSDADAEDVVQEAYLRAVRFFGGFRGGDGKAWLLAIVRNASHTRARLTGRDASATVPIDEDTPEMEDGGPGPEGLLLQEASRQQVKDALEALPVEFREVVVLRELEGLSYKEIADVMEVPIGTVMSRLARARARLRCLLEERIRGGEA